MIDAKDAVVWTNWESRGVADRVRARAGGLNPEGVWGWQRGSLGAFRMVLVQAPSPTPYTPYSVGNILAIGFVHPKE